MLNDKQRHTTTNSVNNDTQLITYRVRRVSRSMMASQCVTMPRSKLQDSWVADNLYLEATQETLNQFWFKGQQLTETYWGSEVVLKDLMHESGLSPGGVVNDTFDQRFRDASEEWLNFGLNQDSHEYITDPAHVEAYGAWVSEKDDSEPSNYMCYDQAWDNNTFMGGINKVEYTPEMLDQLDQLNWYFNFVWNPEQGIGSSEEMFVPDLNVELQLVAVGDNHGIAKCQFGGVFVPKGVLRYLGSMAQVGTKFNASVTFVNQRYPWRVSKNSVTYIHY